jgi:hypothetical protein
MTSLLMMVMVKPLLNKKKVKEGAILLPHKRNGIIIIISRSNLRKTVYIQIPMFQVYKA